MSGVLLAVLIVIIIVQCARQHEAREQLRQKDRELTACARERDAYACTLEVWEQVLYERGLGVEVERTLAAEAERQTRS